MSKFLINLSCAALFLCVSFLLPAASLAIETGQLNGQITSIDYGKQSFTVQVLNASEGIPVVERLPLVVDFIHTEDGCIDWTKEQSRDLAGFFAFKGGDIVKVDLKKADGIARATRIVNLNEKFWQALAASKKIASPSLIETFSAPSARANLIVTLKETIEGGEPRTTTILGGLTEKDFTAEGKLQGSSIVFGSANITGLVKLLNIAEVSYIEENLQQELH